ncbi:hypothetical protein GCM10009864_82990 [Streptomyces lunalinharesii]|uniref:Uncharacterized protein n=1 Tax=Streptomyces lunalinharesii TaxID=333384 RepID=A0ABP6FLV7_9ACTN
MATLVIRDACYTTGQITTHNQNLTGATAKTALGGFHLAGLALAFGLMVAAAGTPAERLPAPQGSAGPAGCCRPPTRPRSSRTSPGTGFLSPARGGPVNAPGPCSSS